MSIFSEYSGPSGERGYYSAADWNKLQNPDWAGSQEEYDRFAAQAAARAESRAEAMSRAREAIPFSYTQFGRGGTEPVFSLAGYSGHTSGGTAGLSGFAGTGSPVGYSTSGGGTTTSGGSTNPGDQNPGEDIDPGVIERAEGGAVPFIQYMQEGGMIQSPYADPMKPTYTAMPMPMPMEQAGPVVQVDRGPMPQQGIGGLFEQMHSDFGRQMGMMQSSPLKVYQNYLMQTYAQPEMQQQQQKVDQFLDLVDQAERAHFGSEQSYGFGGGPMAQQYMPQPQQQMPQDRGVVGVPMMAQARPAVY